MTAVMGGDGCLRHAEGHDASHQPPGIRLRCLNGRVCADGWLRARRKRQQDHSNHNRQRWDDKREIEQGDGKNAFHT
jgi:hypothetical protein